MTTAPAPGDLLKLTHVAQALGVSEMTVRRYVAANELRVVYLGRDKTGQKTQRRMRFTRAAVDAFIRRRSGPAT